jgi:hypothetical protein
LVGRTVGLGGSGPAGNVETNVLSVNEFCPAFGASTPRPPGSRRALGVWQRYRDNDQRNELAASRARSEQRCEAEGQRTPVHGIVSLPAQQDQAANNRFLLWGRPGDHTLGDSKGRPLSEQPAPTRQGLPSYEQVITSAVTMKLSSWMVAQSCPN